MTNKYGYIIIGALVLASCSHDNTEPNDGPEPTTVPLNMYISVPSSVAKSRVVVPGDPGEATDEADAWDRLTVVVAYTSKQTGAEIIDPDPGQMVYYDTFTKEEFECRNADGTINTKGVEHAKAKITPVLNADGTDSGYRTYVMPVPLGNVRVYGITYSSDCQDQFNPVAQLNAIAKDGANHNSDIADMRISNDYATATNGTVSTDKFVSVATGVAYNYKEELPSLDFTITKGNDNEMRQYWSLNLHRLAVKLDIQWDAYGAYNSSEQAYIDVDVNGFEYNGGDATATGSGYGRLFPFERLHVKWPLPPVGGKQEFVNQSTISKRNGRVTHYIFPDGSGSTESSTSPRVTFNLNTKRTVNGETVTNNRQFTYDFSPVAPLTNATWYKLNAQISGNLQENATLLVKPFNN